MIRHSWRRLLSCGVALLFAGCAPSAAGPSRQPHTLTSAAISTRAPLPGAGRAAASPPVPGTPSTAPTLPPGSTGRAPVFSHGPRDAGKVVALTFDADMTPAGRRRAARGERFDNPGLIGDLRRLRVPATVFITGIWAEQYPDEVASIGHDPLFEVGNHSYRHYAFAGPCYGLPRVGAADMRDEVTRTAAALRTAGAAPLPYFRFPGGCHDDAALRAVGTTGDTVVQWDVVSGDAFATSTDDVVRTVLSDVRPGSVVVMHCTLSAAPVTAAAVRRIVPALRSRGYRFVKVSDLIAAAAERR